MVNSRLVHLIRKTIFYLLLNCKLANRKMVLLRLCKIESLVFLIRSFAKPQNVTGKRRTTRATKTIIKINPKFVLFFCQRSFSTFGFPEHTNQPSKTKRAKFSSRYKLTVKATFLWCQTQKKNQCLSTSHY